MNYETGNTNLYKTNAMIPIGTIYKTRITGEVIECIERKRDFRGKKVTDVYTFFNHSAIECCNTFEATLEQVDKYLDDKIWVTIEGDGSGDEK